MTEHERITCAYHESGHAVVAALLPAADPLHKVTIIPRGRALGVTMQLPEGDRHTHSREFLEAQIAILMGGRIAEELFLRQMTSGAGNDIERATEIARRMVCEFGMSAALGPLAYRTPGNPWEHGQGRRHQRSDRAAGGRGSPRAGDARLRDGAPDHRQEPRTRCARWPKSCWSSSRSTRKPSRQSSPTPRSISASRHKAQRTRSRNYFRVL